MSSAEIPVPLVRASKPPRTWKFFGTALWGALAFGAMSLGQLAVIVVALGVYAGPDLSDDNVKAIAQHGATIATSVLAGLPAALLVLWIAIRLARRSFPAYLALRWPSGRELLFGLGASIAVLIVLDTISYLAGYPLSPDFVLDSMRSARDSGTIWLALLGFCFAAPIGEEFIFRGFVYRGWSTTFLGPFGAIILCSVIFAIIHVQYEMIYVGGIFVIGLVLGYLRYRSGSTWMTVIIHGVYNFLASMQALWFIR